MTDAAAVVVGIGQHAAGDDGVGIAVARLLSARGFRARECADASLLLALLGEGERVVVVDALVGHGEVGDVVVLEPGALEAGPRPLSSHGVGVAEALALAQELYGGDVLGRVSIVGVVIAAPVALALALSTLVGAAVGRAADVAGRLAADPGDVDRRG